MGSRQFSDDLICFEEVFREYYPGLLLFVERHLGDREFARDIVQDVFHKLYVSGEWQLENFNIKSWLYKVSRNAAVDYIRHLKVIDHHRVLMAESMIYAAEVDEEINEELAARIRGAIGSLPEQCRVIIEKSVIEGKKYTEIAQELNISINTVRTQISRGYKKLREQLASSWDSLILLFCFRP